MHRLPMRAADASHANWPARTAHERAGAAPGRGGQAMTPAQLAKRLQQAEARLGVKEDDPDAAAKRQWAKFWRWFQATIADWPEPLALARQRVAGCHTWET